MKNWKIYNATIYLQLMKIVWSLWMMLLCSSLLFVISIFCIKDQAVPWKVLLDIAATMIRNSHWRYASFLSMYSVMLYLKYFWLKKTWSSLWLWEVRSSFLIHLYLFVIVDCTQCQISSIKISPLVILSLTRTILDVVVLSFLLLRNIINSNCGVERYIYQFLVVYVEGKACL